MKKGPPRRYVRHDHCQSCPNSFVFFFFCFHDYLLFFTGELPTIRLETMWNSPHKGMLGTIAMIVPLFLSFFCFFDYLLSVYRKTAHNQAMDDRERSPQRYAGHDHNNCALYLFFFSFQILIVYLQENCPHSGS